MTSYEDDLNYRKALEYSRTYSKDLVKSEGFNLTETPALSDKIIIAQNNTIIALLIDLHKKLENIREQPKEAIDIDNLVTQFNQKLDLGSPVNKKKLKKAGAQTFITYQDKTPYKNVKTT